MAHDNADIDDRVYKAVVSNKSVEELRRIIDEFAQGDDARRAAAVNKAGINEEKSGEEENETPLQAAERLGYGALLVADADVKKQLFNREATALALCCRHGQFESVRALLQAGHDANEKTRGFWWPLGWDAIAHGEAAMAAHVCAASASASGQASLECLSVLVQEGGVDINARDEDGLTPLHWLSQCRGLSDARAAVEALVALGADLEARDERGTTPLAVCAQSEDLATLLALLDAGASVDVKSTDGWTPLMLAVGFNYTSREVVEELLRRSSDETRRAEDDMDGSNAIDLLVSPLQLDDGTFVTMGRVEPWHFRVVAELQRSGAAVGPETAAALLRSASRRGAELDAELRARRSDSRRWRAHDCFVQLAFDHRDAREAEERVRWREAKLRELEEKLRELGSASEGGGGDGDEGDGEEHEGGEEGEGGVIEARRRAQESTLSTGELAGRVRELEDKLREVAVEKEEGGEAPAPRARPSAGGRPLVGAASGVAGETFFCRPV